MIRCPACGGTNPAGADWCGQCYAALGETSVARPAAPAEPTGAAPEQDRSAVGDAAAAVVAEAFRQRDGEVEWGCVGCGTFNALELGSCTVCGTAFAARFAQDAPGAAADSVDWRAALALTVLLPGSGHVVAGRAATGLARAFLFVVWFGGGVVLALGGGPLLVTVPLFLGAVVVWGTSVLDIVGAERGGPEVLRGRVLVWLVVGVTLACLLGLVARAATLA